jgi:hypothetical protein
LPNDGFVQSPYAKRAFIGERIVTTTETASGGKLVIASVCRWVLVF